MINKRAVALIEILISLTILTLVSSALGFGTNYLVKKLLRAKNAASARHLAWKRLAEVRSETVVLGNRSELIDPAFEGFKCNEMLERATINNRQYKGLYKYRLMVQWQEAYSSEYIILETLFYQRPNETNKKELMQVDDDD